MKARLLLSLPVTFVALQLSAQDMPTYQSIITGQAPSYYFKLDNNLVDSVSGSLTLSVNGTTGAPASDAAGNANSAYLFHGGSDALYTTTDMVNGGGPPAGNASATGKGSLSLLFMSLNSSDVGTGQRFVFAQGAVTSSSPVTNNAFAVFYDNDTSATPSALRLRAGNTTTTMLASNQIALNTWYYLGVTWDETRNSGELKYYIGQIGGVLSSNSFNINDASVVGNDGTFFLGNKDSNFGNAYRTPSGDGAVDELAIWNSELASTSINAQFNSFTAIPEPAFCLLFGLGGLVFTLRRRVVPSAQK